MGSLRNVVVARNIRSILFRLSRPAVRDALCGPQATQVLQALKNHGFRLGLVGDKWSNEIEQPGTSGSTSPSVFDFIHFSREVDDSVYARAARALDVPLARTMLVSDGKMSSEKPAGFAAYQELARATIPGRVARGDELADPVQQQFAFTEDLLSFDKCLDPSGRWFGPYLVQFSQVFYESALSFALVNLKPIVPGHVLIVPKRCVDRFELLDADEVADLWCTAQVPLTSLIVFRAIFATFSSTEHTWLYFVPLLSLQLVGKNIEKHFQASSLTFAIQDGASAGQTVKHVHIHVLPRKDADFANNDDVYTEIEAHERSLKMDNESRTARTEDDMAREAAILRTLFFMQAGV